jgi:lysophospholipase L1-like esterase
MTMPQSRYDRAAAKSASRTSGVLTALVFGTLLALILAEILLRLYNPLDFRVRGDSIVLPRNHVYRHTLTETSDGRKLDFAGKLDTQLVHTKNSLGFRGPEPSATFASDLTIITVGGSTTECFYLNDADAWPARMGGALQPHFKSLWVNNAGLDGHSSFGHLRLMQQYLGGLKPKVVTVLAGVNDMFVDAPTNFDVKQETSLLGRLSAYSEVAALIANLQRVRRAVAIEDLGAMPRPLNLYDVEKPPAQDPPPPPETERRHAAYKTRLEALVAEARQAGIVPVLITQPALFGAGKDDITRVDLAKITVTLDQPRSGANAWALLESYNDVMRGVARELNVPLIDLARELPKSSRLFYDLVHFSKAGGAAVGEIVARDLCPILAQNFPNEAAQACGSGP